MNYINREILEQLYLTENLTKKEIAKTLDCSYYKVEQSVRKYNFKKSKELLSALTSRLWNEKSEEEKAEAIQKSHEWYKALSPEEQKAHMNKVNDKNRAKSDEEKAEINKKRKQAWENKSEEDWNDFKNKVSRNSKQMWQNFTSDEKDTLIEKMKKGWDSISEEDKKRIYAEISVKNKEAYANKSEEEKVEIISKQRKTKASKTDEEKAETIKKFKDSWYNASEEKKQERNKHLRDSLNNRTPEQKAEAEYKRKQTCLERYGVENVAQTEHVKEKHSEAWKTKTEEEQEDIKNRIKNSCIQAWVDKPEEEIQSYVDKIFATKHKNKSWNTSKAEYYGVIMLKQAFGEENIETQYKSVLYPHRCDAYIKSLDLYIEFNYHWTHGFHPFDENNSEDIERLEKLKKEAETSDYFASAINVWTVRDVQKINDIKQNHLNAILFYSEKEFQKWLDEHTVASISFELKSFE